MSDFVRFTLIKKREKSGKNLAKLWEQAECGDSIRIPTKSASIGTWQTWKDRILYVDNLRWCLMVINPSEGWCRGLLNRVSHFEMVDGVPMAYQFNHENKNHPL